MTATTPPITVQKDQATTVVSKPVIDSIAVDPVMRQQRDETIVFEAPGANFDAFVASDDGRSLPDLLAAETGRSRVSATESVRPKTTAAQPASFRKPVAKPIAEITKLRMTRTQVRSLTIGGKLVRVSVADKDVCQVIAAW